jgi:sarcosine/dimethylglycine N-methyltransferase
LQAEQQNVVRVAERYYDSNDADQFYFNIWGGEDIHIGIYESETEPVRSASRRTVERMAGTVRGLDEKARVLDLGAGYGGAARYLAKTYGCHVTCLNLSETQNRRNRELSQRQGLGDSIRVVHGNFEELRFDPDSYDVVWSQDSFLHSARREQVLGEVARVLKPKGQFVFTDPMQADDCPSGVLGPVLARIHLESMGSFAFYRAQLAARGFEELSVADLTEQLGTHYARVRAELTARYDDMCRLASKAYVDRMLVGLENWVRAESSGHLRWGILHFEAP